MMKRADVEDMDDALHVWMREAHAHDIPISDPILQVKEQELAAELGHPEFRCSNGWLSHFKTRKGLGFRTIKGKSKAIKPEAMDAWKNTLRHKLLKYICNADETGLVYKLQHNKPLVFKEDNGRGDTCSKSRITVIPMSNMSSTYKLKPLVINNCWKLHIDSQKRINVNQLPVESWMSTNSSVSGFTCRS